VTDMTRRDRNDLLDVAKMRARVAKAGVAQREAELLAQVEEELSTIYSADDAAWKEITAEAAQKVKEVDEQVAAICRERGVPEQFRPRIDTSWYGRGENASKERRAELRKLAQTRITAAGRKAKTAIDAQSVEVMTELIAGALESDEARRYLDKIPTPAQLMPPIVVAELEALTPPKPRY
jgi:DNA primase